MKRTLVGWMSLAVLCVSSVARAELLGVEPSTAQGDGVYGRFNGDLDLGLGLGLRASAPGFGPNVRLSAHFLSTVGLVVDATRPIERDERWTLSTLLDLRPLFLPRWYLNLEQGPAFLDLLIDSLAVSVGPVFRLADTTEVGLGLELGLGVPLSGSSEGLWIQLRGASRWLGERPPLGGVLLLSWQTAIVTPIVD